MPKTLAKKTEKPETPRFCATMGAGSGKGGKARPPVVSENLVFFGFSSFFPMVFTTLSRDAFGLFGFSVFSGGFCKVGF